MTVARVVGWTARRLVDLVLLGSLAAFAVLVVGPHVLGYRTATMLTTSMAPTIDAGDVVLDTALPVAAVEPGMVITYHIPVGDRRVVSHRVLSADVAADGSVTVRTRGDANDAAVPLAWPGPAAASFTSRVLAAATATTATVAPPTAPSAAGSTTCLLNLTTSYAVRLSWTASTSARVTGYRVTETVGGVPRAPVTVTTTNWSRAATKPVLSTVTHQLAVVAVTDYGWTSVPATAVYTC